MAKRKKADTPRKFMELAVRIMQDSISETRPDGKVTPKVGAVLITPQGEIITGHRGELREGDHAEYTVIERKNRDKNLSGSVLYATLEPCAPGARKHPKLSCAERIVNARIKEVWIGIADPDPTVNRKGLKFLQESGVRVHLFDRDLQKIIENENKSFLRQASKRAEKESEPTAPKLSETEDVVENSDLKNLSPKAIQNYLEKSGVSFKAGTSDLYAYLNHKGILEESVNPLNGKTTLKPTGVGLILFGKNPRDTHPHAVLKAQVRYGDGNPEIRDFDGPLVLVPEEVEAWLRRVLHSRISRRKFTREEEYSFPISVLREAVINALVHRDYDNLAAKTFLEIDDEKIVIKSPGLPVSPIQLKEIQNFEAPSLSRNPKIMHIFNQMRLVEEIGLGMETLKSLPEQYNLPLPLYSFKAPFLILTFPRTGEFIGNLVGIGKFQKLNKDERKGILFISSQRKITKAAYAKKFEFDTRKAERHLSHFVKLGICNRFGSGPSTYYEFALDRSKK